MWELDHVSSEILSFQFCNMDMTVPILSVAQVRRMNIVAAVPGMQVLIKG